MVAHLLWEQRVAGSNPVSQTITRQSGLPKVVNTDLLVKLPPAQPNIQASFFTALLEACDMWLSGKRLIKKRSKLTKI